MTKITIKAVPTMDWMTEKAIEVVNNFNECGHKLIMIPFEDDASEKIEDILEEGMYYFEFPDCPEAVILEEMIEEASYYPRYIHFTKEDLEM